MFKECSWGFVVRGPVVSGIRKAMKSNSGRPVWGTYWWVWRPFNCTAVCNISTKDFTTEETCSSESYIILRLQWSPGKQNSRNTVIIIYQECVLSCIWLAALQYDPTTVGSVSDLLLDWLHSFYRGPLRRHPAAWTQWPHCIFFFFHAGLLWA